MKKERKEFIISIIAIVILVLFVLGATYAYFQAQTGEGASTDINITSSTVDSLTFSVGDAISLNATQSNFGTGSASLSGSITASATLVANNSTNYAETTYYLYVKISSNDFSYTTSDSTPELILSITGPDGEVTSLSGLTYTTVTDNQGVSYSGFDITTESGLITIAELYEIVSTGTETDEWTITVTFINLSTDQSQNAGASFGAEVIIQQEEMSFSNYIISLASTENNLYYHASDVSQDTTGTTYEADYYCSYDGNEVYNFESWSTDDVTESSCNTVYKVTDDDYTGYFDDSYTSYITEYGSAVWDSDDNVCKTSDGNEVYTWYYGNSPTEQQCSGTVYYDSDYDAYLVGVEYVGSGEWINLATLGAQDNSYRYSGASDEVDNYVCFGSDEDVCPDDNLYRIIGAFQNENGEYEVKLIKADYANNNLLGIDGDYSSNTYSASSFSTYTGSYDTINRYYWNYVNYSVSYGATGYYNIWSYSQLNTVNLNTNYWNKLESKWQEMVTTHTWIVHGGPSDSSAGIPSSANISYLYEIANASSSVYDAKVGLMYVSDYGYAASPTYWDTLFSSYYSKNVVYYDWLYVGLPEWTITRSSSANNFVFYVIPSGAVAVFYAYTDNFAVRPCFYLSSDVLIESGSGTYDSPYRISL